MTPKARIHLHWPPFTHSTLRRQHSRSSSHAITQTRSLKPWNNYKRPVIVSKSPTWSTIPITTIANMSFQYPGVDYDLRYRVDALDIGRKKMHWKNIGRESDRFHAIGVNADLAGCKSPILQVREVAMMIFMDKITDKEGWEEKVFDDDIVAKWRQEAMTQSEEGLWKMICPGPRFEARHADKIHMPRKARIVSEETFNYVCGPELRLISLVNC